MKISRIISASALAASASIVFTVAVTIWGEQSSVFKNWLQGITGHHWTTKSLFSVLVYAASFGAFLLFSDNGGSKIIRKNILILCIAAIVGTLVLVAFFVWHFISV